MAKRNHKSIIPDERIEQHIYSIRSHRVMLDSDLADLYGVTTKRLNESVKRNWKRFPTDFMFRLTNLEAKALRSQFATSKKRGGRRYLAYAFTENGVAMLSSVLNTDRAIQTNITIMRVFTRLRKLLASHSDLIDRLNEMEKRYDKQFQIVFDAIRQIIESPEDDAKPPIGYLTEAEK
jgi:hypothetical protein